MSNKNSLIKGSYLILIVIGGLSHSFLYFFSDTDRWSRANLIHSSRPIYTIMTSPLALVFDTPSFFSTLALKLNFQGNMEKTIEMNSNFIKSLPFSPHVRLHLARYSIAGLAFKNDKKIQTIFCNSQIYSQMNIPNKIVSFEISTYLYSLDANSNSSSKKPETQFLQTCTN